MTPSVPYSSVDYPPISYRRYPAYNTSNTKVSPPLLLSILFLNFPLFFAMGTVYLYFTQQYEICIGKRIIMNEYVLQNFFQHFILGISRKTHPSVRRNSCMLIFHEKYLRFFLLVLFFCWRRGIVYCLQSDVRVLSNKTIQQFLEKHQYSFSNTKLFYTVMCGRFKFKYVRVLCVKYGLKATY